MTTRKHAVYGILALVSLLGLGITQSASAGFIATINQVGANVVVTGSGTVDLTGLSFSNSENDGPGIAASIGTLDVGQTAAVDVYGGITGPSSFGSGSFRSPNSVSGDAVFVNGRDSVVGVPQGYVSGAALSDSMTFNSATFATLGVTPGTYVWTWGTGAHADSFTIQIGPAGSVPDAGSTLPLLGFASLGLVALRRKLRC
jgi:hypothetical protein